VASGQVLGTMDHGENGKSAMVGSLVPRPGMDDGEHQQWSSAMVAYLATALTTISFMHCKNEHPARLGHIAGLGGMREDAKAALVDDLVTGHGGGLLWDLWKEPTSPPPWPTSGWTRNLNPRTGRSRVSLMCRGSASCTLRRGCHGLEGREAGWQSSTK
jgi:hypothetical protein